MRHALIVLLLLLGCGSKRQATPSGPPRIVSLTPSATEVVAALGATSLLVGVDQYSDYPKEVEKLPKVGSFLVPNIEAIVALKPTLVIVDDIHGQVAGALRDRGLETIECDMHALPDVKAALLRVGAKLGRAEQAKAIVAAIDHDLDAAAAAKPAKHPKVLVIIDREAGGLGNIVAAGPGSWLDELLAVVGGDNVLAASISRYPKISREEVLTGHPDVILDVSHDAAKSKDVSVWQELDVPAVKAGHVEALVDSYFQRPSPRVRAALETLTRAIY
jgi:iron complex transport system substrate-binding protein